MRSHKPWVAAACLALAGAGGCGGSSGLSHAELVKKSDGICTQANKELGPPPQATSLSDALASLDKAYAVGQKQIARLKKLKPSKSDREAFRKFIDAFAAADENLRQQRQAAARRDVSSFRTLQSQFRQQLRDLAQAASKVGLTVCGASG